MAGTTEGLPIGMKLVSRERTITEGEFHLMQCLTWQTADIHTDREYMKTTEFGERIMSGSIMLSVAMGLEGTTDKRAVFRSRGFRDVAQLGIESLRFTAPVYPGDSVWVEVEILDGRPSKKNPKRWVMKVRLRMYKRPDVMVLDSVRYSMVQEQT